METNDLSRLGSIVVPAVTEADRARALDVVDAHARDEDDRQLLLEILGLESC